MTSHARPPRESCRRPARGRIAHGDPGRDELVALDGDGPATVALAGQRLRPDLAQIARERTQRMIVRFDPHPPIAGADRQILEVRGVGAMRRDVFECIEETGTVT